MTSSGWNDDQSRAERRARATPARQGETDQQVVILRHHADALGTDLFNVDLEPTLVPADGHRHTVVVRSLSMTTKSADRASYA